MKLYVEGHNRKFGYAVSREYSVEECRAAVAAGDNSEPQPLRFVTDRHWAFRLVERFNRRFADKP